MWSHRDPSVRRSNAGNVYIKNLDPSIDSSSLRELFQVPATTCEEGKEEEENVLIVQ